MEHTPILHILSFEWQNTIFKIWDKSFTNKGRGWCNRGMGFDYAKKKVINNMAKLKLDQHDFKIQYQGIIGIVS